jgi:hypothetical protein
MDLVCIETCLFLFYIIVGISSLDSDELKFEWDPGNNIFDWNDSKPFHINNILYPSLVPNHCSSDETILDKQIQSDSVQNSHNPSSTCKDHMEALLESDWGRILQILETEFNEESPNSLGQILQANPNTNILSFLKFDNDDQMPLVQSNIDDQHACQNPTEKAVNQASPSEIGMVAESNLASPTNVDSPSVNHSKIFRNTELKNLMDIQSHPDVQTNKRTNIHQNSSSTCIHSPSIVTRPDHESRNPEIFHNSGSKATDMVEYQLGFRRSASPGSSRSGNSLQYSYVDDILSEIETINDIQKMGSTAISPPPEHSKSINEILKFNADAFQQNEYESILDKSHSQALVFLIKDIQPEHGQLCISEGGPEDVHRIFKKVELEAHRIRRDETKQRKRLEIQENGLEKAEVNHKRKYGVTKSEEEKKWLASTGKCNRKSLGDKSFGKLFNKRSLWYRFWEDRTGIKIIERSRRFQEKVVLFLHYIYAISTILENYMVNESNGHKYDTKFLLQTALNIVSKHFSLSFQEDVILKSPNFQRLLFPADESPKKYKLHRQEWIWIWITRFLKELNNQKLRKIFFQKEDGVISRQSQTFFNNIFYYSIDKLNQRLSWYYEQVDP